MSDFDTLIVDETETPLDEFVVEEHGHFEPELVVEENTIPGSDMVLEDEQEEMAAKDTDWENDKDYKKFIAYLKKMMGSIPKHSGNTIPGCERAKSFLKDLLNTLSKAMRNDLKGEIDEQQADDMYKDINGKISMLDNAIDKLRANTQTQYRAFASPEVRLIVDGQCDKCASNTPTWHDVENDRVVCLSCEAELGGLQKVATTPALNVVISAFERAIVGTIINAGVSNGKNIEDVYHKLDKKYKFTDREKLSIRQLVADYGYPILMDRAKIEENDGENNGELARNYHA